MTTPRRDVARFIATVVGITASLYALVQLAAIVAAAMGVEAGEIS